MGRVRFTKPSGMRPPDTFCCPRHAIIWQMFTEPPLEPQSAMARGVLWKGSSAMHICPALSRTRPSRPFMLASRDCSRSQPGCSGSVPCRYCAMSSSLST